MRRVRKAVEGRARAEIGAISHLRGRGLGKGRHVAAHRTTARLNQCDWSPKISRNLLLRELGAPDRPPPARPPPQATPTALAFVLASVSGLASGLAELMGLAGGRVHACAVSGGSDASNASASATVPDRCSEDPAWSRA